MIKSLSLASAYPCLPQRNKEQKKADAAGTRAPVKPNGLPVKAPKPTSIVSIDLLRAAHGLRD